MNDHVPEYLLQRWFASRKNQNKYCIAYMLHTEMELILAVVATEDAQTHIIELHNNWLKQVNDAPEFRLAPLDDEVGF